VNRNPIEPGCPRSRFQTRTGDYVGGIGHTVTLKARNDLFDPTTTKDIVTDSGKVVPGIKLYTRDEITSIPGSVGCLEVVSVGKDVQNVKPGDVVFIDLFDVRQGVLVGDPETQKSIEGYIANDDAIGVLFDEETGELTPLPGYAITRRNIKRFQVALTGTDRVDVPINTQTYGIVSGRTSEGTPAAFVVYEEVVAMGPPEFDTKTRTLTKAERALLDFMCTASYFGPGDYEDVECRLLNAVKAERSAPRELDAKVGDLVAYSTDFAIQVRVRGEFLRIVPQFALLCTIDDRKILDEAIRAGKAGQIVRVA
jgi:hypothetical protein